MSTLALLYLVGCGVAQVGTATNVSVPKDSPARCAGYCSDMGMTLGQVVVMASYVGCVCDPPNRPVGTTGGSAGAVAGMNAIRIEAEQQAQAQAAQHH